MNEVELNEMLGSELFDRLSQDDKELLLNTADELDKCPECGESDFYELWSGDDEDAELEGLVCKKCCKSYPTKKNYLRHRRKIDKNFGNYNIPY